MTELETIIAELPDPNTFLNEIRRLESFLLIDEGPRPVDDRASAEADAAALRRVISLVEGEAFAADLSQRLANIEAALAVKAPGQRTLADLREFVAFNLCDALAAAKGIPVALLQTGQSPNGIPPSHDTAIVWLALDHLKLAEGADNVRRGCAARS